MNRTVLFELAWILPSVAVPVGMLVAILVAAFGMQIHVATDAGTVHAHAIAESAPFDQPGVTQIAPGRYQVAMIARAWSFQPNEIRVPAGSRLDFVVSSADVIHGLRVDGTNVNMMVIPGRIGRATARFDRPGEYLIICHEYCGVGHHGMYGKVIVEERP